MSQIQSPFPKPDTHTTPVLTPPRDSETLCCSPGAPTLRGTVTRSFPPEEPREILIPVLFCYPDILAPSDPAHPQPCLCLPEVSTLPPLFLKVHHELPAGPPDADTAPCAHTHSLQTQPVYIPSPGTAPHTSGCSLSATLPAWGSFPFSQKQTQPFPVLCD